MKLNNRNWNQTISEYVGMGHPDRVADFISDSIRREANTSATEVVVNSAGVYASGETTFHSLADEKYTKIVIEEYIDKLLSDYGVEMFSIPVQFNFVKQNKMLAERKGKLLSGDQEIVYYHKLDKKDVHYWLRQIDNKVSEITETYDYKILVNMENKTMNLSISTTHKDYVVVKKTILELAEEYFGKLDVNICEFRGGSILNDTGVTGRKLIVEKEGTGYPHGGGAYFGKDETKAAVYGYDLLKKANINNSVLVYFPGDKLTEPNFVCQIKKERR